MKVTSLWPASSCLKSNNLSNLPPYIVNSSRNSPDERDSDEDHNEPSRKGKKVARNRSMYKDRSKDARIGANPLVEDSS